MEPDGEPPIPAIHQRPLPVRDRTEVALDMRQEMLEAVGVGMRI